MGVIEVDPKNILEDGIRKELLKLLSEIFHKNLDFSACYNYNDLNKKFEELSKKLNNVKKSFIYIQDYINIDGSRMWSEELHRLINYFVDIEANSFLNKKIRLDNSKYDLNKYSIPKYLPIHYAKDAESITFLGRIIRYCLNLTKPKNANFYPQTFTWYDSYNNEIFGIKTFNVIKQFFGVEGLQGMNRLVTYMNYNSIYILKKYYNKISSDESVSKNVKNFMSLFKNPLIVQFTEKDTIKNLLNLSANICKQPVNNLVINIISIGQLELFKLMITHCIKDSLEVESNILNSHLQNLNNIHLHYLKNSMEMKFKIPENLQKENEESKINSNNNDANNSLLNLNNNNESNNKAFNSTSNINNNLNNSSSEFLYKKNYFKNICHLFEDFGFSSATKNYYMDLSNCNNLIFTLAVITFNEIIRTYQLNKKTNEVTKNKRGDDFDINYFFYGILTILYQFNKDNIILYLSFLTNIIKQYLLNLFQLKDMDALLYKYTEFPANVVHIQSFMIELIDNFEIPLSALEISISSFLIAKKISSE
jgi:hypothetical protein